jgi:tetratricopeptide (TPR) repeat protein
LAFPPQVLKGGAGTVSRLYLLNKAAVETVLGPSSPQSHVPAWKSRAEYDAFNAMATEQDLTKKVSLAEAFLQRYENSDFRDRAYVVEMQAYQQLKQTDKAIEAAHKALEVKPDNLDALRYSSFVFPFAYKADDSEAAAKLSRAESDAKHGFEVLQKIQKPEGVSDEQFNRAIKGLRAIFNGTIGFVALQRKDYTAAITSYKAASEDNPSDWYIFYRMGLAYLFSNPHDYDNGIPCIARALALARAARDPNAAQFESYLKQVYTGHHGSEQGLEEVVKQAAESVGTPVDFAGASAPGAAPSERVPSTNSDYGTGSAAAEAQKAQAANAQASQQAEERAQEQKQGVVLKGWFDQGYAAMRDENYTQAVADFEQALPLAKGKDVVIVLSNLAEAYQKGGQNDKAVGAYQKAIAANPSDAALHNSLGKVYAAMSENAEAEVEFRKAVEIDPAGASQAYYNLGTAMTNSREMREAAQAFKQARLLDPTNADAFYWEAWTLMATATLGTDGKSVIAPLGAGEALRTYLQLDPQGKHAQNAQRMLRTLKEGIADQVRKPDNGPERSNADGALASNPAKGNQANAPNTPQPIAPHAAAAQPQMGATDYAAELAAVTPPSFENVDSPPALGTHASHAYALVIAAEKYRAPIPAVPYASHDAAIVRRYLVSELGLPAENIKGLSNPTLSDLRAGVQFVIDQVKADTADDTTLYVYYAGHGVPDLKSRVPFLLPVDASPAYIQVTGFSLKELADQLGSLRARSIVWLDACFSGSASRPGAGEGGLFEGARPAYVEVVTPANPRVIIFSATAAEQISNALEPTQHGLFTYFLLSGLGGKAADSSGLVTVRSLYEYLLREVPAAAVRMNQQQTPTLSPSLQLLGDAAGSILVKLPTQR